MRRFRNVTGIDNLNSHFKLTKFKAINFKYSQTSIERTCLKIAVTMTYICDPRVIVFTNSTIQTKRITV